jgi:hypothetical protein
MNYAVSGYLRGWAALVLVFLPSCGPPGVDSPSTTASRASDVENITGERFETVRRIFEAQGARVDRDPKMTNTVRIYLPASVAVTMTKLQAQNIASEARGRLGGKAIVYVKNPTGDTLGKAAPWGLE